MGGAGQFTGKPVVFLGPTLRVREAERVLDAEYLAPAAQGSFVAAVQRFRPAAILLIDGIFQGEPAVRHKEILWTMAQGVPVIGAASMGALRAAELWSYGMAGVGLIFRWYRRCRLAPDDAVAVLHGPPEIGSPPLTQSLIDLRIAFRLAERRGIIDRATRLALAAAAIRLNFRDRTIAETVALARRSSEAFPADRETLTAALEGLDFSQKRNDALQALQTVAVQVSSETIRRPDTPEFVLTAAFLRDLEDAGLSIEID
jgi:hypothetical protein